MARKNKKYMTKSINFGNKGDTARSIIESLEKRKGKTEVSQEVRKALIAYFSKSKDFKKIKISGLLEERKEIKRQMKKLQNELDRTEGELNKLDYQIDIGE